jgi:hypothetical protein
MRRFLFAGALAAVLLVAVALAAYRTSSVEMTPVLASTITTGYGGLYTKSTDGRPRFVSSGGTEYRAGTATDVSVSAGVPGAAALGSCWMDSTDSYRLWCKESAGNLRQRTDVSTSGSIGLAASPAVFLAHANTLLATQYLGGADRAAASATQITLMVAHSAQSVRALACSLGTAPGVGMIMEVFTVQGSIDDGATWMDLATTCTITGTSKRCVSTVVSPLIQYQRLAVKVVRNALSVSADFNCQVVIS